MTHHRIIWRIAGPSLGVSVILLAVVALAAQLLRDAHSEAEAVLDEAEMATLAAEELENTILEMRHRLAAYADGELSTIPRTDDLEAATGESLVRIGKLRICQDGRLLVGEIQEVHGVLRERLNDLESVQQAEVRRGVAERLVNDLLDTNLVRRVQEQRALTQDLLNEARARSQGVTRSAIWLVVSLGAAGALVGTLAGFGIARGMRQELVQLSVPIQDATGKINAVIGPLKVSATEEEADLEQTLNRLGRHVTSVVERLQSAERETLRADQLSALGQLAAGLAHELRNPLATMKTLVELGRDAEGAPNLNGRDLDVLYEEITRMNASIQSFLDYARPPRLEKRETDLREVVERTRLLAAPRAEQQAIELSVAVPDRAVMIEADPEQLRQVLLNLVLNALQAIGREGEVSIDVTCDHEDSTTTLRVRDDGPGLPEEMLDRVFEPFVSSKDAGTGLGLTICRRIVEDHGGTIGVANRAEGGAEFTVTLPMSPEDDEADADESAVDGVEEEAATI